MTRCNKIRAITLFSSLISDMRLLYLDCDKKTGDHLFTVELVLMQLIATSNSK